MYNDFWYTVWAHLEYQSHLFWTEFESTMTKLNINDTNVTNKSPVANAVAKIEHQRAIYDLGVIVSCT